MHESCIHNKINKIYKKNRKVEFPFHADSKVYKQIQVIHYVPVRFFPNMNIYTVHTHMILNCNIYTTCTIFAL